MPNSVGILALLMDYDQQNTVNEAKDRMRYKRGDIVDVYPPGTPYLLPPKPPWLFIDVTGAPLTVAEAKARYEEMEYDVDGNPYRRRIYWVDLDSLPNANKADLAANRYTEIAWNKVKSSLKNKVTGQPEG